MKSHATCRPYLLNDRGCHGNYIVDMFVCIYVSRIWKCKHLWARLMEVLLLCVICFQYSGPCLNWLESSCTCMKSDRSSHTWLHAEQCRVAAGDETASNTGLASASGSLNISWTSVVDNDMVTGERRRARAAGRLDLGHECVRWRVATSGRSVKYSLAEGGARERPGEPSKCPKEYTSLGVNL